MSKQAKTLRLRLPGYVAPRLRWRSLILKAIGEAMLRKRVDYDSSDKLEVRVKLYLRNRDVLVHDVDNRLKDILDTLQGRVGGPKGRKPRSPLIPNDNQIWRIVAEKGVPPPQSRGMGHLTIRRFRA